MVAEVGGPSGVADPGGGAWQQAGRGGKAKPAVQQPGAAGAVPGGRAKGGAPVPAMGAERVVRLAKVTGDRAVALAKAFGPRKVLKGALKIVLGGSRQPRPDLWDAALREALFPDAQGSVSISFGPARSVHGADASVRFLAVSIDAPASLADDAKTLLSRGAGFLPLTLPVSAMPGFAVVGIFSADPLQLVHISMDVGPCSPEQMAAMLVEAQAGVPGLSVLWVGAVAPGALPAVHHRHIVCDPPLPTDDYAGGFGTPLAPHSMVALMRGGSSLVSTHKQRVKIVLPIDAAEEGAAEIECALTFRPVARLHPFIRAVPAAPAAPAPPGQPVPSLPVPPTLPPVLPPAEPERLDAGLAAVPPAHVTLVLAAAREEVQQAKRVRHEGPEGAASVAAPTRQPLPDQQPVQQPTQQPAQPPAQQVLQQPMQQQQPGDTPMPSRSAAPAPSSVGSRAHALHPQWHEMICSAIDDSLRPLVKQRMDAVPFRLPRKCRDSVFADIVTHVREVYLREYPNITLAEAKAHVPIAAHIDILVDEGLRSAWQTTPVTLSHITYEQGLLRPFRAMVSAHVYELESVTALRRTWSAEPHDVVFVHVLASYAASGHAACEALASGQLPERSAVQRLVGEAAAVLLDPRGDPLRVAEAERGLPRHVPLFLSSEGVLSAGGVSGAELEERLASDLVNGYLNACPRPICHIDDISPERVQSLLTASLAALGSVAYAEGRGPPAEEQWEGDEYGHGQGGDSEMEGVEETGVSPLASPLTA